MKNHVTEYVVGLLIFVCGVVLGSCFGQAAAKSGFQRDAAKASVARWTINPETGERKFEFIQPKP